MTLRIHRLLPLLLVCLLLLPPAPHAAEVDEPMVTYPLLPDGYASIKVYDRAGRYAGRILSEQRYWVPLERIPPFLQTALVAIEDSRFYEHGGIDLRGIARALVKDVVKRNLAEGGSTITQQLVKNKYLTAEKTIDRKVREGFLAMELEKKFTKQQILEMYFNEIYYGNGAWGIVQAARLYYDKNPEELTDAECAILAGIPKNPGRYNPLGKRVDVDQRRKVVLNRMLELELISRTQHRQLTATFPEPVKPGSVPQYLNLVRSRLIDHYGPDIVERGGLDITAAMDLNLQRLAEKVLREGVRRLSPELQGALVAFDPGTGDLLAMAGSVDYAQSTYNRALVARRQPGSTIKPLIYAAALDLGISPSSRWDDAPVSYPRGHNKRWKPLNYGGETFGELSLRAALAHSNNVITVKLLDTIGVSSFVDFAGRLGLTLRTPNDLSLALGTDEVTLHDLTLAYTPFATGGLRPEPRTIVRIFDRRDKRWLEHPVQTTEVLDPATAFVTTQLLRDVLSYGTGRRLQRFAAEWPAAGKTGTTDDYRDAWFIGYTPQLITGVWVGHDQPKPGGKGFTGGAVAAPIWEKFMRPALTGEEKTDFTRPDTVVSATIDADTGLLATADCPQTQEEFYIAGFEPDLICPLHAALFPELPEQSDSTGENPELPASTDAAPVP